MDGHDGHVRLGPLTRRLAERAGAKGRSKVQRLRDAVFAMIESGAWRPGEKLPPDKDLAEYLSLSLGTVQAAMQGLKSTGLVARRRGAGTFVADAVNLGSNAWHFRFRTRDRSALMPIELQVLSIEETDRRGEWSDFLGRHPTYIKIRRVVDIGREFKSYSEMYLEAGRFRPLLDVPIAHLSPLNFRIYLHDHFNAPTLRAIHRLRVATITEPVATLIDCADGVQGMAMSAYGYTFRDAPISLQKIVIPPTEYELEILG
ncbi:MAG: GntR family transcriptional regulator [Hyphomicrobiales bacterium]|nr:GntR family transcriptional regulator [Hyphomicrobiales bacterium]MCP5374078.1 GntR family transcriptional regulator [Hyphomicrobiales bacterium]